MPRQAAASVQNSFVKGLITEATGLNFPENACTETFNCVFDERGRVRRRLGIDFEEDHETQVANRTLAVVNSYYWKAAAGNGDNALVVLQVGATLYFYFVGSGALSEDMVDTIDLNDFLVASAPSPATSECQFTSGNGFLFVSHPNTEPFYVTYDPDAQTVSGTQIELEIRDFEGLDDGLEFEERPSTLSDEHNYNLYNQGWYADEVRNDNDNPVQVLTQWDSVRSDFPSNADIWWGFLQSDGQYDPRPGETTYVPGNAPAPKGHFLLNPFYQDRSAVSGIGSFEVVTSGVYRPSTIAFFAGRVWYSGVSGQRYSNKIYFSQIVEGERQFGTCFQTNDPTSEERFDLLPTDGGVISIQDAGTIVKLWPIENSLLVFATNGVWGITGSEGIGFRANDYSVRKLSSIPALTATSFVDITGFPAWWNSEGIYIAASDSVTGSIQINPLTDNTIRTFYEDIPANNKRLARGYFNTRTRVVHWIYRTSDYSDLTQAYEFDGVLNLNMLSSAFYPWTVDSSPVSINGIVVVEGTGSTTQLETVTDNALATVTNAALATVEAVTSTTISLSAVTKFVSSYPDAGSYRFTFAEESSTDYEDWSSYDGDGDDFTSYFVTGYMVHGDAQRKMQPNYIYLFNETNEEENQLDFRSQWNYSTSGDTGRWSSTQRLVFPESDYSYQFKRIKTRGHGLACQFNVTSVSGEPFRLIGWSTFETQNASI